MDRYPLASVSPFLDVVVGQILCINIWKSGIATEDEDVPYRFKSRSLEFLSVHNPQFLVGKVTSVHLIEMQMLQLKRISLHPAVIPRHFEDAGKSVQELYCSVIVHALLASEPKVEFVEEAFIDVRNRHVCTLVFSLHELFKSGLADFVSEETLLAIVLCENKLLVIGYESVAE